MGFAAVARVTEDRWVACVMRDLVEFGLVPGGELDARTTICDEIRGSGELVVFDHASAHDTFRNHPTPTMYGFESYTSVPIKRSDGSFFGTLCALDPRPVSVNRPEIIAMFALFADLIATHLDSAEQLADLRDREERLRLALDGGNLGTWDVDPRSGEAIWSDHHAAMHGYRPSDQP
ncbi:MAG: sensor histidine kinase, partial [Acidimicrobiales bacterium]|nr:sensor histidine kinase [Acidimicrobiales bacterium]